MGDMTTTQLSEVDLNLLVALESLLQTCSVTETARQLGRTQSGVSHALRRLRELFGDELLVRVGGALVPTARAQELAGPLRDLMRDTQRLLGSRGPFEPQRLQRTFTIAASDLGEIVVLPRLLPLLAQQAPGVVINVVFVGSQIDGLVQSGQVDLAWGANFQALSGIMAQPLFEERNVCVVRKGHPRLAKKLTLEDFVREPHVAVSPRGMVRDIVDEALERLGHQRRVVLRLPHFVTAPLVVASSDLLLVAPSRVALALAAVAPLQILEPPLPLPHFSFTQAYGEMHRKDPAHQWLRAQVVAACAVEPHPVPR